MAVSQEEHIILIGRGEKLIITVRKRLQVCQSVQKRKDPKQQQEGKKKPDNTAKESFLHYGYPLKLKVDEA